VSIGEGLAQARRAAGLSLAQVSQRTRIRERIIADIEGDDYSACGGDFYARGHIRSIARAIGTDPEPFIREYDAVQPEPDEFAEAEITQPGMAIGIQPGIPLRTEPGPPLGSAPGVPLGTEPGQQEAAEPGWRTPAEQGWSEPAAPGWSQPAAQGWNEPAAQGWNEPAAQGWNESAVQSWSEPAAPGRSDPAEPGWRTPAEQGWDGAAEPGWRTPAAPGWSEPAAPGRSEPAAPGLHTPAEADWRTPAEQGWSEPAAPGWSEPAEPDGPIRTDPGPPTRTDPGFPFFDESATTAGARSAPPDGPRLPPPPVPPGEPRTRSVPPPPVPPGRNRGRNRLNWAVLLALVLLAGIGYLAYHIFAGPSHATSSAHSAPARPPASPSAGRSSPPPSPTSTTSPSPKPTPASRPLAPAGAQALGVSGQGDDPADAHLAIDGHPGTPWRTDWYTSASFGNLYSGTGLLVDMGRPVTITAARIQFGAARGGSFQLRVGPRPSLAGMQTVAHGAPAGVARLHLASPAHGRYVLIWFTSLPVDPSGSYRASVYDVQMQGR
jgi:transcriptional regulator with XRE-family HTH domain